MSKVMLCTFGNFSGLNSASFLRKWQFFVRKGNVYNAKQAMQTEAGKEQVVAKPVSSSP